MNTEPSVAGFPVVQASLDRALREGKVHHAYLFHGAPLEQMAPMAWSFARALVCSKRGHGQSDACMECSACARVQWSEEPTPAKHPDVIVLARGLYDAEQLGRRTPEGQELSADQIRAFVLPHRGFGPSEGRARVFLLYRPEELSIGAANTLLKTLEEPGEATHFVLLSEQPGALLDTIRSRCLALRFLAAPQVLSPTSEASEPLLAALRGSAGAALALADLWKKDKAALQEGLQELETFLGVQVRKHASRGDAAGVERVAEASAYVHAARDDLDGNVSPALAVERMFFSIQRLGAL